MSAKSKSVEVYLDAADTENRFLTINDQRFEVRDDLLKTFSDALKSLNLKPMDVTKIEANLGPGSFTGLRKSIAISNTFKYVLNLSDLTDLNEPNYGQPPKINQKN